MSATRAVLLVVWAAALAACSSIADVHCAPGYSACSGRCVSLQSDPTNCGRCGIVCASGTCSGGLCTETTDAAVGDASPMLVDAANPDAGAADASDAATSPACDVGQSLCGGVCVRLAADPSHCGACNVVCDVASQCSDGTCVATCPPGSTACGRSCVDLQRSPTDCGACGFVCDTGVCEGGACVAGRAGHVVVIGHDYSSSRPAMVTLLDNALRLGTATPRVVRYGGTVAAPSAAGITAAVSSVSGASWTSVADPQALTAALDGADVLLVDPQHGASARDLDAIGMLWSRALTTFLSRGGAVIALDVVVEPDNGGAARWLAAAALVRAGIVRQDDSTSVVRVVAPADALTVGVPLSYRAEAASVRWLASGLPVVVADGSDAVVTHRTVVP